MGSGELLRMFGRPFSDVGVEWSGVEVQKKMFMFLSESYGVQVLSKNGQRLPRSACGVKLGSCMGA
jgi:hypothetical protein